MPRFEVIREAVRAERRSAAEAFGSNGEAYTQGFYVSAPITMKRVNKL